MDLLPEIYKKGGHGDGAALVHSPNSVHSPQILFLYLLLLIIGSQWSQEINVAPLQSPCRPGWLRGEKAEVLVTAHASTGADPFLTLGV